MGRFKDELKIKPIVELLESQGFEYGTGARGEPGYTRTYLVDEGHYYVWVTVNVNTGEVNIYKEYSCGGMVASFDKQLSKHSLIDVNLFIDELDEILDSWISE